MANLSPGIIEQIEQTVSANPDANVSLLDSDGIFRYIAPTATALFGYSPAEIQGALGMHHSIFSHPSDVSHLNLAIEDAILNGESVLAPRQIKLKSGGYRRMSGAGRKLVDETTGDVYILVIGRPME